MTGLSPAVKSGSPDRAGSEGVGPADLLAIETGLGFGSAMLQQHTYGEIEAALASIVPHGAVFEIRLLTDNKRRTDSGYFSNPSYAANAIAALTQPYKGIYVTPNPVNPDLLARAANRINQWAQHTTMDPDILQRRWLLIDIDATRVTGISSTDPEHQAAIKRALQIKNLLGTLWGFCDPMLNDSGNGAHLLYPINLPNTEVVRDDIARFLKCVQAKFSDKTIHMDTMIFNASRIWRVPGTWARKGDNTPDRPHRKAAILENVHHLSVVRLEQINSFSAAYEHLIPERQRSNGTLNGGTSKHATEYPQDERRFKLLNDNAMRRVQEWCPVFFPSARPYREGFRISSNDLGRIFEEDVTIHPWPLGIKDFGSADQGDATEGRRTPIALIAEFCFAGDKELAARRLADILKLPITEFESVPLVVNTGQMGLPGIETQRPRISFKGIRSIADLQAMEFPEQKFVINGVLPTCNTMLLARPKMRKTWLCLQLGMAIATGDKFLEWTCTKGDVLFLGLEDNQRRLRARINKLQTFLFQRPDLTGFRYWTGGMDYNASGQLYVSNPEEAAELHDKFPRGEAGVDALEQFLDTFPLTSTIIIDTYNHFRAPSSERDIYQRDYDAMMPITRLCARRQVLAILVHHEKKGNADREFGGGDWIEDASGSAGITAGVDALMSIKGKRGVQNGPEERKLFVSGRDVPFDYEVDMSFDAERGGWLLAARQDLKLAIIAFLQRHPWLNQQELLALLPQGTARPRLTQVMAQLKMEGVVTQNKMGYGLVQR